MKQHIRKLFPFFLVLILVSCNGQDYKNVKRINGDNSWGYVDENGKEIIPLGVYEFLNPIDEENMILAKKNGKEGYIDILQKVLIPFEYDDIGIFSDNGIAPAKKEGKWGGLDRKGNTIIPFIYDELGYFYKSDLAVIKKNGKYGFINGKGKIIIPLLYDNANQTMSDNVVIASQKGKWAFFNNQGKQLTDFLYDEIKTDYVNDDKEDTYFKGGVVIAMKNNKPYFLNRDLNEIKTSEIYSNAEPFTDKGFSIVEKNEKFGIISNNGKVILPTIYVSIEHPQQYSNKLEIFAVKKNSTFQIFNSDFKPITNSDISDYSWIKFKENNKAIDALILRNQKEKNGIINITDGHDLIPFQYDELNPIDYETFIVKKGNSFGVINNENKTLIPINYTEIYPTDEHFLVKNSKENLLLDKKFKSVLKNKYQDLEPIFYDEDNKYIAKKNGKYGIIDLKETNIAPFKYDEISNWVEYGPKAHFVTENHKKGLISYDDKKLNPTEFETLSYISDDYIIVSKAKKYGIVDIKNNIIIPINYDKVYVDWIQARINNEIPDIYVLKKGIYSIVDKENKVIKSTVSQKIIDDKFSMHK